MKTFFFAVLCSWGLLACGEEAPPTAPALPTLEPPVEVEPEPAPVPVPSLPDVDDDPLAGLDDPSTFPDAAVGVGPVGVSATTAAAAAPAGGCVALADGATRVWPVAGPTAIVAHGDAYVVAGIAPANPRGEELWVVRLGPDEAPRPVLRHAINPTVVGRHAGPALAAIDDRSVAVSWFDGAGAVHLGDLVADAPGPFSSIEVGRGADARFAPAVAASPRFRLVAYTDGTQTPMRMRVTQVDARGHVDGRHDVTPEGIGGAAPSFMAGDTPPTLHFIDPHMGTSALVRVTFSVAGAPHQSEIARPLGNVFGPPQVAAGRYGDEVLVGYTAVGSGAATAVGLARYGASGEPPAVAIVPSSGYGLLHVAAATGPGAVVFAATSPKASERSAPREVHVRVAGAELGPALTVAAPDGTAHSVALARGSDGIYALSFAGGDGTYVAFVACDDGGR